MPTKIPLMIKFPSGSVVNNSPAMQEIQAGYVGSMPELGKSPGERKWQTHSSILPWIFPIHGVTKELDVTGQLNKSNKGKIKANFI